MQLNARSIALCGLISLLLVACGSSPPVRYFALESMSLVQQEDSADAIMLGLGPLRLPEYLNRSQIVTRGSGSELEIDEFSRWAEPLTMAFHRVVSTDVDNMMDDVSVIAFPWEAVVRAQVDYRLLGEVTRFDADQAGRVVLEIQWAISEVEAGAVVVVHRSRYETHAAGSDDPAVVAAAMNEVLGKFSRDVVSKLGAVLRD